MSFAKANRERARERAARDKAAIAQRAIMRAALHELATKIALDLMTNGAGQVAERLVMWRKNDPDGGGWCGSALRDRIEKHLCGEI